MPLLQRLIFVFLGIFAGLWGHRFYRKYPFIALLLVGAVITFIALPPEVISFLSQKAGSNSSGVLIASITGGLMFSLLVRLLSVFASAAIIMSGGFLYVWCVLALKSSLPGSYDKLLEAAFQLISENPLHLIPFFIAGGVTYGVFRKVFSLFLILFSSLSGALLITYGFSITNPAIPVLVAFLFTAYHAFMAAEGYIKRRERVDIREPATKETFFQMLSKYVEEKKSEEEEAPGK